MFEVARDKPILKLVAIVVDALECVFSPPSVQPLSLDENSRVELDQGNRDVGAHSRELHVPPLLPLQRVGVPLGLRVLRFFTVHKVSRNRDSITVCVRLSRKPYGCVLAAQCLFRSQLVFVLLLQLELDALLLDLLHLKHVDLLALLNSRDLLLMLIRGILLLTGQAKLVFKPRVALIL